MPRYNLTKETIITMTSQHSKAYSTLSTFSSGILWIISPHVSSIQTSLINSEDHVRFSMKSKPLKNAVALAVQIIDGCPGTIGLIGLCQCWFQVELSSPDRIQISLGSDLFEPGLALFHPAETGF